MKPSTHTLRALATGALLGAGLSLARAPLGVELALTPALSAGEALTWRALALGVAGFVVGRWGGARPRLVALAWGGALGFALHGLVLADVVRISSRIELYALLGLLGAAADKPDFIHCKFAHDSISLSIIAWWCALPAHCHHSRGRMTLRAAKPAISCAF